MDSILNFFPKGGDPKRLLSSSISDEKLTISDLLNILQHVFKDGIDVEKCPNCEPADEKILDLSFEQAGKRAALHHKCANCGEPAIKKFKYVILNKAIAIQTQM